MIVPTRCTGSQLMLQTERMPGNTMKKAQKPVEICGTNAPDKHIKGKYALANARLLHNNSFVVAFWAKREPAYKDCVQ